MKESDIAAVCHGVRVPHSPFLNETRIARIEAARYEGQEIAGGLTVVREGDRVLEMGTGLGIVGAVIAKNAKPSAMRSYEANPELLPHIRTLYEENGLGDVIELRNEVLLAGPDRPEEITFHLHNSFLGSSLNEKEGRKTRPVNVPTADFDAVLQSFRPDVLIMDIEGGELELLEQSSLAGIRAIVVELHPGQYGKEGSKICKASLRNLGFVKNEDVSTRFVWTCERSEDRAHSASVPPHPLHGWSHEVITVEDAIVSAPETAGVSAPSGVITATGEDVPQAALWRKHRRTNLPFPRPDTPPERLEGTWLWGGTIWRNFAHFIAESLSRLWAVEEHGDVDGLLFIPRRKRDEMQVKTFQTETLSLLGIDLPLRMATETTQVDRLIVPGQGFGIGPITAGTPAFRSFVTQRLGRDITAEGGDKLYISRNALGPRRGGLLGEARIEEGLAAQGYEIFYPEKHSLRDQIARYKAATHVVASEGSALHLLAFLGLEDQHVAVIPRRNSEATRHILTHLHSFTGREPVLAHALREVWQPKGTRRARLALGEPDLPALQLRLEETGFLSPGSARWSELSDSDRDAALGGEFERRSIVLAA